MFGSSRDRSMIQTLPAVLHMALGVGDCKSNILVGSDRIAIRANMSSDQI